MNIIYKPYKEKKQSVYIPAETLRVSGGWGSQISKQSARLGYQP